MWAVCERLGSAPRMIERAYRDLEAAGYSRTTLRTLHIIVAKAFEEQIGRTLGARKPRESDEERPVWTLDEARRFGDYVRGDRLYPMWRLLLVRWPAARRAVWLAMR